MAAEVMSIFYKSVQYWTDFKNIIGQYVLIIRAEAPEWCKWNLQLLSIG